jgi:penicillin amidase
MMKGGSDLFDDKRTLKVETMDDMIVKSLRDAMVKVEATYGPDPKNREWGKVHQIAFESPIGIGPLSKLNLGPFPHPGARETVRNASFSGKGDSPWTPRSGPVLRHIMDMGDPDGAQLVIDGSVSGQWLSPHYDDLVKLWLNGQYVTAVMDPELVKAEAKYHLVMEP